MREGWQRIEGGAPALRPAKRGTALELVEFHPDLGVLGVLGGKS